jgi:hypothetical protein
MPFPVIAVPVPTVLPPVPQKVFDRYYINEVRIRGNPRDPNGPLTATVELYEARLDDAGAWELAPDPTQANGCLSPKYLTIPDVLAKVAAGDATLGQTVGAVMQYVAGLAAEHLTPAPPAGGN